MALIKICTVVVAWVFNEQMVLQHLFSNELGQDALVLLL